jgi:hypothetical protein
VGQRNGQGRLGARRPHPVALPRGRAGGDRARRGWGRRPRGVRRRARPPPRPGRAVSRRRTDDEVGPQPFPGGHRVGVGVHARAAAGAGRRR